MAASNRRSKQMKQNSSESFPLQCETVKMLEYFIQFIVQCFIVNQLISVTQYTFNIHLSFGGRGDHGH
jgi:hypothetical protein